MDFPYLQPYSSRVANLKAVVFILSLFGCFSALAHTPEEGKVTATLGPYFYQTNFGAANATVDSPILGGFGLIAEGDVNKWGGLEIAMIYMHKLYFRQINSQFLAEKTKQMYITMGYRHWFNSDFSSALAFFSSYSMGDPRVIHSDFAPGVKVNTSAQDTTEYGFDFAFQWEFWRDDKFAAAIDARYSRSVTRKDHEDADHYGVLAGLKYQIQEK